MGTGLAVRDGGVIFAAGVAMGDRRYGFYLQFAAPQHLFFVRRPAPTVLQIVGNDGRHFADGHHDRRDVLHAVLFCRLFDVADDIKDDTQFVHTFTIWSFTIYHLVIYHLPFIWSFLTKDNFGTALEHVRQYAVELILGGAHDAGFGVLAVEVDGIEGALGGAYTTTDTAVLIDH